jgi:hypothetical protein
MLPRNKPGRFGKSQNPDDKKKLSQLSHHHVGLISSLILAGRGVPKWDRGGHRVRPASL